MGSEEQKPCDSAEEQKASERREEDKDKAIAGGVVVSGANEPLKPSWFTPKRLLAVFCVINLINYLDRGAIASNGVNGTRRTCDTTGKCTGGTGIQGEFKLNNFEDGVLSSAFMVGLLISSPIFATLAKSYNPFRLIGFGLSVWTLAVAGCGFSFNFWMISACRMLVGVGEASFISLAAPFIDDNAPVAQKTAWLGAFYMCIPTGYAVGYIFGGVVGTHLKWHWAFRFEAILMLPFAILGFVMKPLQLKGFSSAGSNRILPPVESVAPDMQEIPISNGGDHSADEKTKDESLVADKSRQVNGGNQLSRFLKDMKVLLCDRVYVVNVLGYIAYTFVVGAYSYWGPKAGYYIYHMTNADMVFGGITVVCGVLGTITGGVILDYMTSTISNAFKLLSVATFLGLIFCFTAFCFKSLKGFLVFFAIGELLVFAVQAPVNYICLHCVKPSLRPLSMAMNTVAIHIFGDVPSSPLVGVVQDHINDWRKTSLFLTSIFFIAALVWSIGIFLRSTDKFCEESETVKPPATEVETRNIEEAKNGASWV